MRDPRVGDGGGRLYLLLLGSSRRLGLTHHLGLLARALLTEGVVVTVASGPGEQVHGSKAELSGAGLQVRELKNLDTSSVVRLPRATRELREVIEDLRPQVIHAQGFWHLVKVAWARRRAASNSAIVLSVHGFRHGTRKQGIVGRVGVRLANTLSDLTLPMTEASRSELVRFGLSEKRSMAVPLGLDLDKFDEGVKEYADEAADLVRQLGANDRPTIVYAAQLVPRKAHKVLLLAFARVIESHPTACLILAGSGPERLPLTRFAKDVGVNENVVFSGPIEPRLMPAVLHQSVAGVVSSRAETFCHSIVEPMAAGKPVVSTPVGIGSEVIRDGETGFLVPIDDPEKLSDALIQLLDHPTKAEEMGRRAKEVVSERFSWEAVAKAFIAAYSRAVSLRRAQGNGE